MNLRLLMRQQSRFRPQQYLLARLAQQGGFDKEVLRWPWAKY
jgi:hypothetical protein